MVEIKENLKGEVRVITWDYRCHPDCCYYEYCKDFMDRYYECPQWVQGRSRIQTTKDKI